MKSKSLLRVSSSSCAIMLALSGAPNLAAAQVAPPGTAPNATTEHQVSPGTATEPPVTSTAPAPAAIAVPTPAEPVSTEPATSSPSTMTPTQAQSSPDGAQISAEPVEGEAQDIVVTGSARQQRRFDVSYAVNSLSQEDVRRLAPITFADLLGKLPGIQVENTAGEVGGITRVRGIPTDDGSLLFQQDGLPLFHDILGQFFKGDSLNRYDLMTERVEVVRGGPAPIFGSQAAAIANSITVTGSDTPHGKIQATAGTTDLYRLDAVQSGPLGNNTYYAIGGFLRRDGGQRDVPYTNDRGGQIRANIKHDLENGSIKISANYLNDRNGFYLPTPLADPRNPAVSLDPYIDYFTGSLNSPAFRNVNIKYVDAAGIVQNRQRDIADGRHTRIFNAAVQYEGDFNGWLVSAKGGVTQGKITFDAFYSTSNPVGANTFANGFLARFPGATRMGYTIAGTNTVYDPNADSGLVVQGQYRASDVDLYSAQSDLSVTKKFETGFGSHDVRIGVYGSVYGQKVFYTYQDYLLQVKGTPQLLDLVAYSGANNVVGRVTDNGVYRYGTTLVRGNVNTTVYALYANDTWDITKSLRIDAGVRHEKYYYDGYSANTVSQNLGDTTTLADDAVRRIAQTTSINRKKVNITNWTVGANYDFATQFGGYIRASHLETPPNSNLFTAVNPILITNSADQYEAGLKLSVGRSYLYATGFYTKYDPFNASFIPFTAGGNTSATVPFVGQVTVKGVEVDGALKVVPWFSLSGSLTVQDPKYNNFENSTGADPFLVEGNQIIREPKIFGNVRPSFTYETGDNRFELYGSYSYTGKRYVDFYNNTALPAYGEFGAGVTMTRGTLQFQVVGNNITNARGITEGNIRTDIVSGQGTGTAIYGRTNFGRTVRFILSKSW
jgi:iron complex outermembrane receptor protein